MRQNNSDNMQVENVVMKLIGYCFLNVTQAAQNNADNVS